MMVLIGSVVEQSGQRHLCALIVRALLVPPLQAGDSRRQFGLPRCILPGTRSELQ